MSSSICLARRQRKGSLWKEVFIGVLSLGDIRVYKRSTKVLAEVGAQLFVDDFQE